MMSHVELLDHVLRLLGKVPGVSILGHRLSPDLGQIDLSVSSETSARALEQIALGANIGVDSCSRGADSGVIYSLSVQIRKRDEIECGELQLLGVHLVWHLHRTGLLAPAEANRLLRQWCAAEVGGHD